jgi:hypothetical protein
MLVMQDEPGAPYWNHNISIKNGFPLINSFSSGVNLRQEEILAGHWAL